MFEFIIAGGILIIPIILISILAMAIISALFISLSEKKVIPDGTTNIARKLALSGRTTPAQINKLREDSLLGRVLATGLENAHLPRHVLKESIEETGRHVIHAMDKYMTTLGTIAAIAPLLGLLGTVVGMINVFSVITSQGVGSPTELAGGISQALITTAAGISVAVPALIFHRYFRSKINDYAIEMEKETMKLIDTINRKGSNPPASSAAPAPSAAVQAAKQRLMEQQQANARQQRAKGNLV
ncbi:MAG TPA: MotA/TolQ/ExbB proton channel family protein [Leucothrix mucor]|uniref:MotA/TolQ/ExbB proton channel family protein n=1 Tax=Leucothrix mucor TaxID=45248 RepID=A0A7V2T1K1_LEUMU|nr:MotA/TolQ/ExbB proton channel family protein [Leucothrix mucor]